MNRHILSSFHLIFLFLIQSQSWAMSNVDPSIATTEAPQATTGKRKRTPAPKVTDAEKKARREAARLRLKQKKEAFEKEYSEKNPEYKAEKEKKDEEARKRQLEYLREYNKN